MPGFFDIFFRPEPVSESSKPKPKKVKKAAKKPDKPRSFRHPLKEKVASLEAELAALRQPEPEPEPEPESEADEPSE